MFPDSVFKALTKLTGRTRRKSKETTRFISELYQIKTRTARKV